MKAPRVGKRPPATFASGAKASVIASSVAYHLTLSGMGMAHFSVAPPVSLAFGHGANGTRPGVAERPRRATQRRNRVPWHVVC
jgi:hypothetical protein